MVAQQTSRVRLLDPTIIPNVDEVAAMYSNAGGTITCESSLGVDPLASDSNLICRREEIFSQYIERLQISTTRSPMETDHSWKQPY